MIRVEVAGTGVGLPWLSTQPSVLFALSVSVYVSLYFRPKSGWMVKDVMTSAARSGLATGLALGLFGSKGLMPIICTMTGVPVCSARITLPGTWLTGSLQ